MRKQLLVVITVVVIIASALLINNADASEAVKGIISSNTTWTKANSPYTLQGPVAVDKGVTLTIEPGVTVNLNGHYIQVNGTLISRGTDSEKITFTGGTIHLTAISQQTGQASTIENVNAETLTVETSITVTKCNLKSLAIYGSSVATKNTIESLEVSGDAIVTSNEISKSCYIGSGTLQSNNIDARVIAGGTAKILNNKISDGIHIDSLGGKVTISGNEIRTKNTWPRIFVSGSHADIVNNIIIGNAANKPDGIRITGVFASATITGNQIYNCQTGISVDGCTAVVTKNVVANCDLGFTFSLHEPLAGASGAPWTTQTTVTATANTFSRNTVGIQTGYYDGNATISGNNIYENTEYNFKLLQSIKDVKASNNWWGTTDASVINQKIYDNQMDFNLGHVITVPLMSSPASGAPNVPAVIPADTTQPTAEPTSNPTVHPTGNPTIQQTQNPTTTQDGTGTPLGFNLVEIAILSMLIVIAILLVVLILTLRRRH